MSTGDSKYLDTEDKVGDTTCGLYDAVNGAACGIKSFDCAKAASITCAGGETGCKGATGRAGKTGLPGMAGLTGLTGLFGGEAMDVGSLFCFGLACNCGTLWSLLG